MRTYGHAGVWSFDWIISDLQPPAKYFSDTAYPKVYSWRNRFKAAVEAARARARTPVSLKGGDAVRYILQAPFSDENPRVDANDPLQLTEGAWVEIFPLDDGGFTHKDKGRLVKLVNNEVAIAMQAKTGEEVRIHAPRWQFRVREVIESAKLA